MPTPQRMPAKERKISDIRPEDTRVSIIGTMVDSSGNVLIVDDGTGKINVSFEETPSVNSGQLVRVFGKTIAIEGGYEVQGEAVQDFSGADIEMHKKVSAMWENSLQQL